MHWTRRGSVALCLVALVALAGCGQVFTPADRGAETVTPAPVPDQPTERVTPAETTVSATEGGASADTVPENVSERYAALRPDCTRPPSLVVHLQVAALANNDPATNAGIRATWRFASPANRRALGGYENFVETITGAYQPLLNAEAITYGPMQVRNDSARRRVTVASDAGTTTYDWRLRRVSGGEYDGCWMTESVTEQRDDERFDDR